ncbi:hypothetical protein Q5Y75_10040 [Ruegeria sp. 2205SS24-7]|uniref:hypothetical protein n=1 Tax=Ruegeria discodermiae TaxID=3064389 RepID=UPI002741639A|nr:hypothetical protein [Ruegeria sp. 2205SS24-7]MDP5217558.1 hypothetical protein [Ruegeria sp. 2205SS24-7]
MCVVDKIVTLIQDESVRLNSGQLAALYRDLGDSSAEDVVCRAVEELAVRLSVCERLWRSKDWNDLRKSARSLVAIAEQVGMVALARVAADVTDTIDNEDPVATGATLYRLIRVGERSLTAIWDQRDLTV